MRTEKADFKALKTIISFLIAITLVFPLPGVAQTTELESQSNPSYLSQTETPRKKPRLSISVQDEAFLQKMPLRTKIGQMLMIGYMGTRIDEGLEETIKQVRPGAIIVFGRNIKNARQVSELNLNSQHLAMKVSGLPLLIATDQEGGNVMRIKTEMPLPSALALGETSDTALVESAGETTGKLMRALGFNMNLAPVLDVGDPTIPGFIGTRSFGHDPSVVAKMGSSFANGLARAKVLPTAKHFPGHGGINGDSHRLTPEKNVTLQSMEGADLVPFLEMARGFHSKWAVMLGHVAYPKLDPTGVPATYSRPIVEGLLRDRMGFDGIVMTDDIEMTGASSVGNFGERALRAIEAGADLIMIAWNKRMQREIVNVLEKAVKSGRISEERIDRSVRRIISAKRQFASFESRLPSKEEIRLALKNPRFHEIGEATVRAKLSRPMDSDGFSFREFAESKPIILFSANEKFTRSFRDGAKPHKVRNYSLSFNRPNEVDRVMRSNPMAVGVFYVSGPNAARIASRISEDVARRMLLVTIEARGQVRNFEDFRHAADVYYRHPALGKLIAEHYFLRKVDDTPPRDVVKSSSSITRKIASDTGAEPAHLRRALGN